MAMVVNAFRVTVLAVALAALAACGPVTADGSATSTGSSTNPGSTTTSGSTAKSRSTTKPSVSLKLDHTVPNVVGVRFSAAESALHTAGLYRVLGTDDTGRGRTVLDSENWVVDSQSPAAGTRIAVTTEVKLKVRRPSDTTSTPTVTKGTVPRVICMNLQDAQDALRGDDFYNLGSTDGTGQGRMQILDRDWLVIKQSVPAGSKPGFLKRIVLTVVKYGESTGSSGCKS